MTKPKRIINLNGGTYNEHIEGSYIQGKPIDRTGQVKRVGVERIETEDRVINLNGGVYYEQLEEDNDIIDI